MEQDDDTAKLNEALRNPNTLIVKVRYRSTGETTTHVFTAPITDDEAIALVAESEGLKPSDFQVLTLHRQPAVRPDA